MIQLLATLCSLAIPTQCREVTVSQDTSMNHCMIALRDLPEWAKQYPAQRVAGWRCRIGGAVNPKEI